MKIVACFMAWLVVFLAAMPCADDICKDHATKAAISITPDQGQEGYPDSCSPFCQCACCAGVYTLQAASSVTAVTTIPSKIFSTFLPDAPIEISSSIWQPPRANS